VCSSGFAATDNSWKKDAAPAGGHLKICQRADYVYTDMCCAHVKAAAYQQEASRVNKAAAAEQRLL
jgi:hypothetical protein